MYIDITKYKCPITFVRTKIALEKLESGEKLTVRVKKGDALNNMPESLTQLGYVIEQTTYLGNNTYSIIIGEASK
tara:strand:+ start:624 stop:848 length:225 start_codon:yes stop_codon:yes gene_type:complete